MREKRHRTAILTLIIVASTTFTQGLQAAEDKDDIMTYGEYKKSRGGEGIIFDIPEDYPLKKIGNYYLPGAVEDYVAKKIEALDKQVKALQAKDSELEARLDELQEMLSNSNRRLRSREPGVAEESTETQS